VGSGVKKVAPGCPIGDRWGVGIHLHQTRNLEISARSIFSHLPDGTGTNGTGFIENHSCQWHWAGDPLKPCYVQFHDMLYKMFLDMLYTPLRSLGSRWECKACLEFQSFQASRYICAPRSGRMRFTTLPHRMTFPTQPLCPFRHYALYGSRCGRSRHGDDFWARQTK
jgi:hypothetical protein